MLAAPQTEVITDLRKLPVSQKQKSDLRALRQRLIGDKGMHFLVNRETGSITTYITSLSLHDDPLDDLPSPLVVNGDLCLDRMTNLTHLPQKLSVHGTCKLTRNPVLVELPDDFEAPFGLDIAGTPFGLRLENFRKLRAWARNGKIKKTIFNSAVDLEKLHEITDMDGLLEHAIPRYRWTRTYFLENLALFEDAAQLPTHFVEAHKRPGVGCRAQMIQLAEFCDPNIPIDSSVPALREYFSLEDGQEATADILRDAMHAVLLTIWFIKRETRAIHERVAGRSSIARSELREMSLLQRNKLKVLLPECLIKKLAQSCVQPLGKDA